MIADLTARLTRKSRSNFYYAFLTLPRPRREALCAVYAFCRTVDDIADLGGERGVDPPVQRRELRCWREEVARCYAPGAVPDHPIALRLQAAVRAYTIPRAALEVHLDPVDDRPESRARDRVRDHQRRRDGPRPRRLRNEIGRTHV